MVRFSLAPFGALIALYFRINHLALLFLKITLPSVLIFLNFAMQLSIYLSTISFSTELETVLMGFDYFSVKKNNARCNLR